MMFTMSRARGRCVALAAAAVTVLAGVILPAGAANAAGSVLLNETFTGASVADPLALPLDDACLTGAAAGSTPPAGESALSDCTLTAGSPTIGAVPGWLQLTDAEVNRHGTMLYNKPLPSNAGLQVEFDQAQYGGSGADGISFFLSDGSRQLTSSGSFGGSLGYSAAGYGATIPDVPGIAGGYIGVGFDAWGNFLPDGAPQANCATPSPFVSRVPNTIAIRGPGDGMEGYCLLAATAANGPTGPSTLPGTLRDTTLAPSIRNVRVIISPDPLPVVTVFMDFTGTGTAYQQVLSYTMTVAPPPTFKFGFASSTGSLTDVHLIRNLVVTSVLDLGAIDLVKQVDNTTPQPAAYAPGDTVPYQFVVRNTGAEVLNNVVVDDPKIANVSCPATTLGSAGTPTSTMVCTGTYTLSMSDVAPTFTNTATVDAVTETGTPVNDVSTVDVAVIETPGIEVVKSATPNTPGAYAEGQVIDYSFLVNNTGNVDLANVTIDETAFTGSGTISAVSCPDTVVPAGASMTCTASYTLTQTDVDNGSISNTATATGTPPSGGPITSPPSTTQLPVTPAPGITVEKTANVTQITAANQPIVYSFEVTNIGNVSLDGVTVTDTGFTGTGTLSPIVCPAGPLAPTLSVTCTATYTVTQEDVDAGTLSNSATATGTPPGTATPPITSPPSTVDIPVAPAPSITVVKTSDTTDLTAAGQLVDYEFEVENTGNVTLTDVTVTETSFSGSGTMSAITCPAGAASLAPGAVITCTASYTVTQTDVDTGVLTNTATATGTPPGTTPPPVSPPSTAVIPPVQTPGVSVVKTSDATGISEVGQEIVYSFEVENTGNVTLTDVTVTDTGFTGSGTLSAIDCPAGAASMAPGAIITCTASYTVTQADLDSGTLSNTATATGTPPGTLTPPVSPPSTVDVPFDGTNELTVVKTAKTTDVNGNGVNDEGDRIDWTIEVANIGAQTVSGIAVSDPTAGPVSCPATSLAPGKSMTCTVPAHTITAADVSAGAVNNVATATGVTPGGTTLNPPPGNTSTPVQEYEGSNGLASTGFGGIWAGGFAVLILGLGGALAVFARRRGQRLS